MAAKPELQLSTPTVIRHQLVVSSQSQAQQTWSTHRELVALVLSSRTHSRRPAHQLFAGLWSLDNAKPRLWTTAAGASGLLSLSSECATPKCPGAASTPNQNPSLGNPIPINPTGLQVWWARVCRCGQAPETVFPANPSPPHVQPHRLLRQNLPQPCHISTEPEFVICYQTQE